MSATENGDTSTIACVAMVLRYSFKVSVQQGKLIGIVFKYDFGLESEVAKENFADFYEFMFISGTENTWPIFIILCLCLVRDNECQ